MKLYGAIDLHSNNSYLGIMDEQDNRVYKKRLPNDLGTILHSLSPYRERLEGIVVESTYNWYWLVDGLNDAAYKTHLANPAAIKQYEGLKHSDDNNDAFFLAHLLRLGILPVGYIYPKEERPVRDLLRKRLFLVQQRTAQILSFQSLVSRCLGTNMACARIKNLLESDVENIFDEEHLILSGKASIGAIIFFTEKIKEIESSILKKAKLKDEYRLLITVHGIGKILALTIMLETGNINRFPAVGNYASYARCVNSKRISNGKVKGEGNRKNGNKYLSWAYVEAANFAIRSYPNVKKFYQRKMSKTNNIVAIKAVANKLARACYYVMKDQEAFDPKRAFC